jgi:hypothetical protein
VPRELAGTPPVGVVLELRTGGGPGSTRSQVRYGARAWATHQGALRSYIDDLALQDDEALQSRPLRPFPKVVLWLLRDGRDIHVLLARMAGWASALADLVRDDVTGGDVAVVVRYLYRVAGSVPAQIVQQRVAELVRDSDSRCANYKETLSWYPFTYRSPDLLREQWAAGIDDQIRS